MPTILMPALSPTMEEGKLAKWLKKVGDQVKSGDVLAEIETDKATMEVEAIDEGPLTEILVPEGTEGVKVNSPIAVIGQASAAKTAAPANVVAPVAAPPAKVATPIAPGVSAQPSTRAFASPLAKRIAKQKGIDLSSLNGSGPHGRVILKDVESAKSSSPLAGEAARSAGGGRAQPASDDTILKLFAPGSYELVPHDGMRKTIARRLTESKQTIPHFYVSVDVTLDHLLDLRERLNLQAPKDKDGKPLWKVSVNDFIIKAVAMAMMKVPDANVSWTDTNMVKHKHADIGVAVSIPGGLITPIIRSAETKGLATISQEMKDYAKRARDRKLKPEEYTGGSAAISNMGMMNVKNFAAIVNPPHGSILAIGTGERRPVVRGNDIVIEQQMTITLSTDHRCIDGALGAEFIGAIKGYLEEPGLMLV
jgi:pyruvate dehydrogenase E2 component (dihydrolipoamide acetyltransferase)